MTPVTDPELQRVEQRVVAAAGALAEYEHALGSRDRLARDVLAEEERVRHLTAELARERGDVEKMSAGVRGFLYALLGDERLSIEQRQAVEAEARLAEATASRDLLSAHLASLDARLARQLHRELADAASEARAAKEELLIRLNHPAGMALQELAVRIQALDIELIPLEDALVAGEAAVAKLSAVVETLDRALVERVDQADARGSAGEAQASITVFQRAIDALGMAEDATLGFATLIAAEERTPFADGWIRALVGKGERLARLANARSAIVERLDRTRAQLVRVRARHDELAPRRERLRDERSRLLG